MGGRSQQACEILAGAGFHDVTNVLGGWGGAPQLGHTGWLEAGLPVEDRAEQAREYAALQKKAAAGDR
jgi:rhodanese-related sulfurtransferase